MARLAIRATGDKSRRESITVGNELVTLSLYRGNERVCLIHFNDAFTSVVHIEGKGLAVHEVPSLLHWDNTHPNSETRSE